MNISAAAQTLGISPQRLRNWDVQIPVLNIPRDQAGRRRFEHQHLAMLSVVKRLQEQGRSLESIRVILEPPSPEAMAAAPVEVHPETRRQWLRATLLAAGEAAASRAEALDRLGCQVAELEAKVLDLQARNAHLQASLDAAEDRLQRSELINAVRQVTQARPWWRLW